MTQNPKAVTFTPEQKRKLAEYAKKQEGTKEDISAILVALEGKVTEAHYSSQTFYEERDVFSIPVGQGIPQAAAIGHGSGLVAKIESASGICKKDPSLKFIYLSIPSPPPIQIGHHIEAVIIAAKELEKSELNIFERTSSLRGPRYARRELEKCESPEYITAKDDRGRTLWTYGEMPSGNVIIRPSK